MTRRTDARPVRIGNISGFYGDRLEAAREMVTGGPVDVITGDYLAELTMLILWKARQRDPSKGYAVTFLRQLEEVLGTCMDRGVRIVVNAGGLNPAGMAAEVRALAERLGLAPRVAHIEGDDLAAVAGDGVRLRHLDTGEDLCDTGLEVVTANAYLGGWGIVEALKSGAEIVVCPRVTDASLVVGPAAWWHRWARDDWDRLAGGVAAGHVIECGPQATGGNYSFMDEIEDSRYPGFPIATVHADGSSTITKHADTGGLVSVGTVTAQLLYEIGPPAYQNPDVVAHFDSLRLEQVGPHEVRIVGTRGTPPSGQLKVAVNALGGYRNTMTFVLTGLDMVQKAQRARQLLFDVLGGEDQFDEVDVRLLRFDHSDAELNAEATAHLQVTVKHCDRTVVGRRFSNATMQLALGGYPGFHTTTPPSDASAFGTYWPALVSAEEVPHIVVHADGRTSRIPPVEAAPSNGVSTGTSRAPDDGPHNLTWSTVRAPLGKVAGARSGDKGGDANVGLWVRTDDEWAWLRSHLDVERFRELVPEAAELPIERWELPNLRALNFVVKGLLGDGVASSTRPDPQAKGLGEYVRSRFVEVPEALL